MSTRKTKAKRPPRKTRARVGKGYQPRVRNTSIVFEPTRDYPGFVVIGHDKKGHAIVTVHVAATPGSQLEEVKSIIGEAETFVDKALWALQWTPAVAAREEREFKRQNARNVKRNEAAARAAKAQAAPSAEATHA